MKNLFYAVAGMLLLASCEAQIAETPPPPPPPPPPPAPVISQTIAEPLMVTSIGSGSDRGVLMRNGSLLISQDGQLVPLKMQLTLENGDQVLLNGDLIRKDGSKTKLQEGMMIDKDGVITDKDGNRVSSSR